MIWAHLLPLFYMLNELLMNKLKLKESAWKMIITFNLLYFAFTWFWAEYLYQEYIYLENFSWRCHDFSYIYTQKEFGDDDKVSIFREVNR